MSEECKRRFYKNWHKSKQKAFTKYQKKWGEASKSGGTPMAQEVERAKKYCQVIRAICHTQIGKVKLGRKKAHIKDLQRALLAARAAPPDWQRAPALPTRRRRCA